METISTIFGNQTKRIRIEKNLTQEELATKANIERSQLSKIECGLVDPQISTAQRIADALEVSISKLFETNRYDTHPFVKWAGGKTQLLDKLLAFMPASFHDYYEPFIGGGALLFRVNPLHPYINDMNDELLAAYRCFLNPETCSALKAKLKEYESRHSEENYLAIRALDRDSAWVKNATDVDRAARMIYLNKSCFNGLYRVNSNGFFNVPSGKKKTVNCFDEENFNHILKYFQAANPVITHEDFSQAVANAKAGDFIYFDPPYDTWNETSFTSYDKDGFGKEDQKRLANVFKELDRRGVKMMLSNHNTEFINALYQGFEIQVVNAKRMINSKASGRGDVEEVIIRNYRS